MTLDNKLAPKNHIDNMILKLHIIFTKKQEIKFL